MRAQVSTKKKYSSEILNRNSELTHEIYKSAKGIIGEAGSEKKTANHWAFEQSHSKVKKKKKGKERGV
jgi:hypothetical protein